MCVVPLDLARSLEITQLFHVSLLLLTCSTFAIFVNRCGLLWKGHVTCRAMSSDAHGPPGLSPCYAISIHLFFRSLGKVNMLRAAQVFLETYSSFLIFASLMGIITEFCGPPNAPGKSGFWRLDCLRCRGATDERCRCKFVPSQLVTRRFVGA